MLHDAVHAPCRQQGEYQYPDLGYVCCPMSGPRVVAVGTAEDWKVYSLSSTTAEDGSANHSCMLQKGTTREYAEQSPLEYVGSVVPARLPPSCALALPGLGARSPRLAGLLAAPDPQPAHLTQAADHRAPRTNTRQSGQAGAVGGGERGVRVQLHAHDRLGARLLRHAHLFPGAGAPAAGCACMLLSRAAGCRAHCVRCVLRAARASDARAEVLKVGDVLLGCGRGEAGAGVPRRDPSLPHPYRVQLPCRHGPVPPCASPSCLVSPPCPC